MLGLLVLLAVDIEGGVSMPSPLRIFGKPLLANLAVAGAVYMIAWASAAVFGTGQGVIAPIWPAGGVALVAAIMFGPEILPGIFLPLCVSSLAGGRPWLFSILAPAGMALAAWGGAWLLKRSVFDRELSSTRDILLLAGLGAVLPMALAGFWSAACLVLSGMMPASGLWQVTGVYWATNTAGTVVVAPVLLLIWNRRFWPHGTNFRDLAVAALQLGIVFAAAWLAFRGKPTGTAPTQALAYLPFPFLVWLALSRGLPVAALSVLIVVSTAVVFTMRGSGPFVSGSALAGIWQIEVFIAIVTTTGLLIGAGSEARGREKVLLAEAATRKAELERLKAQIHPHLLFNCLGTIHTLIASDAQAARAGVTALAALLRNSLDVAKEPLVPFSKELEITRDSLRLHKMRYEEGLEWSVEADADAEAFPVPPMLVQPLVENAVKHGSVNNFGRVEVRARIDAGDLLVTIRNTVPPGCDPAQWRESIGLASVRSRLAEACPVGSSVIYSQAPDGWVQALVRIKRVVGGKA